MGQAVHGQQRFPQQEQGQPQHDADEHVDDRQCPGIGFDALHVAAADGIADHHGGGGGHGDDDHLQVLVKCRCHGIGGNGIGGQVAEDGRLHGHGNAPEYL